MKQVTIIIPNYNGKEYLNKCLKSVFGKTTIPVEVIVVDNHSQDGSIEAAKISYPQVLYVLLDKNYGFSKAVNEGIKRTKTPYVILLNNDTEIKEGFVEALLKRIKIDNRIFSVEAKMIQYHNKDRIDSAGTFYNILGWARARGKDKEVSRYQKACYTFAACAGAAIYRKSMFEKIGIFDENYFAYLEDIDIGYRARKHGYINVYEPKAQVYHVGSAASGFRYNEFKVRISARNNIYLIHKNMPWMQKIMQSPFLAAGFFIKTMFFVKKGFGKSYLQGLKEGFELCKRTQITRLEHESRHKRYQMQAIKGRIKRIVDIAGALSAIILYFPVMLVTALAIKITSPGKVIFKQERVGYQGEVFQMYKFRSMIVQDEECEKETWTVKNDPRITKVGKFIRRTSIDELPQLFNVLKGEMSLVGPRPERPYFVEIFRQEIPEYMERHQVLPGMTGWAQINGYRGDTSIKKRVEYDLHYIKNQTLGLDMKIIIYTLCKGFINDED